MFDFLTNFFLNRKRYKTNSEAVVVACFYNPQKSPYRLLAFQKWYRSIKHLNHRIIECLIGDDNKSQLPTSPYIHQLYTNSLLWHKETLLNRIVSCLPKKFKYVFWLDTDVLFTNPNWLVEGVQKLQTKNVIQPFEYCIHLERNQLKPDFDVDVWKPLVSYIKQRHKKLWRSFCANYCTTDFSSDSNYDLHGHVGFAWGARREVLEKCPLYDHALIGGADHIIAHAAADHIPHPCISNAFKDVLEEVTEWSRRFSDTVQKKVGFVGGDLYHIWHGDISKRQYLKRVKEYTSKIRNITEKDVDGLYVSKSNNPYVKNYYRRKEVSYSDDVDFGDLDVGFFEDMGYLIHDILELFGQPYYDDGQDATDTTEVPVQDQPAQEVLPDPCVDNTLDVSVNSLVDPGNFS